MDVEMTVCRIAKFFLRTALALGLAMVLGITLARANGMFIPYAVTDQTPTEPLANPVPSSYQPRYISGFGLDDAFTVFFEDRDSGQTIGYVSTTMGPTGFGSSVTLTNIADTHFVVKDWPVTIGLTTYAYRAWGSVGNNLNHRFYVSDDLVNWTLVSTFIIPNAPGFTDAHGWVYYGFHDVIQLNGTYYAFAESNQSQTMIVSSATGTDDWVAFDSVGGRPGDGPLELPAGVAFGWTPSGNFVDLGHDRGYGKIHVDPRDSNFYLAINTAAKASLSPAELEAAFIDPANWTWHDGTTGPAANPILSATGEHDLRECWVVPNTDPDADWVIVYDADFGAADGGKALGYATLSPGRITVDGLDTGDWGGICPTLTDHPGEPDPDNPTSPDHTIWYVCAAYSDSNAYFRVDTDPSGTPEQSEIHIYVDNGALGCPEQASHGSGSRYDVHILSEWDNGTGSWQTSVRQCQAGAPDFWGGFATVGDTQADEIVELFVPRASFGDVDDVGFFVKYGVGSDYAPDAGSDPPTLIDLASFSATAVEGGMLVAWSTVSEVDNTGFNLWRSESASGPYARLNDALIPSQGGPVQGASYSYLDTGAIGGYYKLEDVNTQGTSTFHAPVEATGSAYAGEENPTAVELRSFDAQVLGAGIPTVLAISLLVLGSGTVALARRRNAS